MAASLGPPPSARCSALKRWASQRAAAASVHGGRPLLSARTASEPAARVAADCSVEKLGRWGFPRRPARLGEMVQIAEVGGLVGRLKRRHHEQPGHSQDPDDPEQPSQRARNHQPTRAVNWRCRDADIVVSGTWTAILEA